MKKIVLTISLLAMGFSPILRAQDGWEPDTNHVWDLNSAFHQANVDTLEKFTKTFEGLTGIKLYIVVFGGLDEKSLGSGFLGKINLGKPEDKNYNPIGKMLESKMKEHGIGANKNERWMMLGVSTSGGTKPAARFGGLGDTKTESLMSQELVNTAFTVFAWGYNRTSVGNPDKLETSIKCALAVYLQSFSKARLEK